LGQQRKAQSAIETAFRIGPENRFITLAAVRFFLHIGDHQSSLQILRSTPLRDSDPWVVGAEIGVSAFSQVSPKFLKPGRKMLGSREFSEFSTSELASALATIELNEGNTR